MSFENPNCYSSYDMRLYEELLKRGNLTEDERRFCNTIYHQEEYASGLDGDRE